MKDTLIASTSITIHASTEDVWEAITTPSSIKKYMMGTRVKTNWKEGGSIKYEGEYNGKAYQDKGVIKKIEPESILQITYWSSLGSKEDAPENYNLITYRISRKEDGNTLVKLTQDNIQTEQEKQQVTENWRTILQKLKQLLERRY